MEKDLEQKLAGSLTAETTDLLPYLPYLLQDLWELGASPNWIISAIKKHMKFASGAKVLDLACGKGAVSVKLAKQLNIAIKGVDIVSEFIDYAKKKSIEHCVESKCEFIVDDINNSVQTEKDYDCVILGAVGDVLGSPFETIEKLKSTIKPNGYIIIDEAYILDTVSQEEIEYKNYHYMTYREWLELFDRTGLQLLEAISQQEDNSQDNENDNDYNNKMIEHRAAELTRNYKDK